MIKISAPIHFEEEYRTICNTLICKDFNIKLLKSMDKLFPYIKYDIQNLIDIIFSKRLINVENKCNEQQLIDEYISLVYFSKQKFKIGYSKIEKRKSFINYIKPIENYVNHFYKKMTPVHLNVKGDIILLQQKISKDLEKFNKDIVTIISYGLITKKDGLRERILKEINVNVCPYCNRNYIDFYVREDGSNATTADLDHFFLKSIFPLFSLSLYNFIPSCVTCNRTLKSSTTTKILYPYRLNDDYNFSFFVDNDNNDEWLNNILGKSYVVKLGIVNNDFSDNRRLIENTFKLFKIKEIYNSNNIAAELLRRKNFLSIPTIKKIFEEISLDKTSLDYLIYGFDFTDEEFFRKPFAKMARDLLK